MNFHPQIMNPQIKKSRLAIFAGICLMLGCGNSLHAASYDYASSAPPRSYSSPNPAPRMMLASEIERQPRQNNYFSRPERQRRPWNTGRYEPLPARDRERQDFLRTAYSQPVAVGEPIVTYDEDPPPGLETSDAGISHYPDGAGNGVVPYVPEAYGAGPYAGGHYAQPCGPQPCGAGCCGQPCEEESLGDWDFGPITRLQEWAEKTWLFDPVKWQNFNEFGGAQAFKGPVDLGVNGNFGLHKGVNWASPLWDERGIGFQIGGTIALSDFEGGGGIINERRDQFFVTSGLFRRAAGTQGLQGGAVVDYLHDEFYVTMNLLQVRGELSYVLRKHEAGLWAAFHTNSDTKTAPSFLQQPTITWQAAEQYNLFYRYRFCNGGTCRTWIGLSGDADVLFGSDATAPLSERWAIQVAYNYLWATNNNSDVPAAIRETWNVAISLVWYPGYRVPNACFNPYRPLFTVADNGSFMLRTKD